jgi:hypothetical protein
MAETEEADVAAVATHARDVQHNTDASWNSTHKKLLDQVMKGASLNFDSIGLNDLLGEASLVLMTEFVSHCVNNPPVSEHTKKPHMVASILDSMSSVMRHMQLKFAQQLNNQPALFPEDDVKVWK